MDVMTLSRNESTEILIGERKKKKEYTRIFILFIIRINFMKRKNNKKKKEANLINAYDSSIAFCSLVDSFLQPLYISDSTSYISDLISRHVSDTRNIRLHYEIMIFT
jgi:hypothetical protein